VLHSEWQGVRIGNFQAEVLVRADQVEVTWDAVKSKWLVRMVSGEEVIRRHCNISKNSDEQTLRSAVERIVEDEGYEPDPTKISIQR
jgi:hypothetical protein